jgi:hypothetical protein
VCGHDARHDIDELLIVDPQGSKVDWLAVRLPSGSHTAESESCWGAAAVVPSVRRLTRWPEGRLPEVAAAIRCWCG